MLVLVGKRIMDGVSRVARMKLAGYGLIRLLKPWIWASGGSGCAGSIFTKIQEFNNLDWAAKTLSDSQLLYAANDAYDLVRARKVEN